MSNEEKARIISNQCYLSDEVYKLYPTEADKIRINSYHAALEMAKWKEDQMIQKAVKWFAKNTHTRNEGTKHFVVSNDEMVQEAFIEKIRQAMTEETVEQEEKDLCKSCNHYWLDFPLPLEQYEPHCEIIDKKYSNGVEKFAELVTYPCSECPFNYYTKKKE